MSEHHRHPAAKNLAGRNRGRRPWQVTVAVLLLLPVAAAWGAAAVGVYRLNADNSLAFAVLAGTALAAVSLYGLAGLIGTWHGQRGGCGTFLPSIAMFAVVFVLILGALRSLAPGRRTGTINRMEWEPTMAVPLTLAAISIIALVLLSRPAARRWFPPPPPRPDWPRS